MNEDEVISWLIEGDVSIQYQVYRDLLNVDKPGIRDKIGQEGWASLILSFRKPDGQWGQGFYAPKWTSTHYTLLDLKNLNLPPGNKIIDETLHKIFRNNKGSDGGINPSGTVKQSDVCINGMVINYACYFKVMEDDLKSIIDFLLSQKMPDGGFNCRSNRQGAVHSSMHSTMSVLEGIQEYERIGYSYRLDELKQVQGTSEEFLLNHNLFKSDKTGEIININFLKLRYPCRWYYDILRAMDYFQLARREYDHRMGEAIKVIVAKRTKSGKWHLASNHPGKTHIEMEKPGNPSRWNTLRALRVLKHFKLCD